MGIITGFKRVGSWCCKHAPLLLTVASGVSTVISVVTAVQATPKAMEAIQSIENPEEHKGEVVKATWKIFIPTAVATGAAIGCSVAAYKIGSDRLQDVTNTLLATTAMLNTTRNAVKNNAPEEIREKIFGEASESNKSEMTSPIHRLIPHTGKGLDLCYDSLTNMYFYCSMEAINKAVNEVNKCLINRIGHDTCNKVYLADLYDELGLEPDEYSKIAARLFWNYTDILNPELEAIMAPNDQPCIQLNWDHNMPSFDHEIEL